MSGERGRGGRRLVAVLALLATSAVGCVTEASTPTGKPTSTPKPSSAPTEKPAPNPGGARATVPMPVKDLDLLAQLHKKLQVASPLNPMLPRREQLVVLNRTSRDDADMGWVGDDGRWCLATLRKGLAGARCGPLSPGTANSATVIGPMLDFPDAESPGEQPKSALAGVVMVGPHAPFAFVDSTVKTPLRQATAVLESGTIVTFLAYDPPKNTPWPGPQICDSSRTACFHAMDFRGTEPRTVNAS
ncbi:hypothetical protein [Streptomyces sp. NPDC059909]|uniref:hypothetical protein n=1 Tax=Streptomyces sp. NPDC059909 TaxID=3346998 RepID=UPI00364D1142